MEFLAIDMYFSCLMLYTKFQDTWNWHISLPHSRSLNYCTRTLLLNFRDWSIPIWHTEMVLLSPCSQILCLFLSSPDKEEHTAPVTTQEVSQLVFSSNSLQLQVCGLCYLYYYGPSLYQLHKFRCLRNCI